MGRDGSGVKAATKTSIEITFTFRGIRCRERIKLQPTAINLKKAERHRQAILDSIAAGTFDYAVTFPGSKAIKKFHDATDVTLASWLYTWLDRKESQLKSSTYNDYIKTVKAVLIPVFGATKLQGLKKKDIKSWLQTLDCSNKRIANILSVLRSALQDAYEDELITENILFNFSFKRNEPPKENDVDPFTREEQELILAQLDGQGKNLIQFAFWSGLRTSELVALEWQDVNFESGVVNIVRAKTQAARKAETTKTASGVRTVKLLRPALTALLDQQQHTKQQGKHVFHNPRNDSPWQGDQAIRKTLWKPALEKAGVKYRRPYQTRHTYASMMLSAGENLAWLSRQLGHSNVLMTAKVYAKFIKDSLPDAGNNAVKLFGIEER